MSCHRFSIAADDACLNGHFPGAPIVPGVVLLDRVAVAVAHGYAGRVTGVTRCKFVAGLYAGQTCTIALVPKTAGWLVFRCNGPGGLLAEGLLQWQPDRDG